MGTALFSRRTFLVRAILGIGAFIAAAVAIPLAGFGILPAIAKKEPGWSDAGSAHDLAVDEPQERRFLQALKTGWQETRTERTVWLVKKGDGSVAAFAPNCPHLGCGYRWFAAEQRFKCPCHVSIFDINGAVLSGPAPRALDLLEAKVEDGKIFVKFEIFQVGISKKTAA